MTVASLCGGSLVSSTPLDAGCEELVRHIEGAKLELAIADDEPIVVDISHPDRLSDKIHVEVNVVLLKRDASVLPYSPYSPALRVDQFR